MDNSKKSLNILSLCSGYGGLEIGLRRALGKINILTHVEIEAFAVANLVNKMETGQMVPAPIWTDLKTFDPKPFRDCVDILTGGYPCQPFSSAGKRNGKEDPRHLWPYIRSIIFHARPGKVFFENVEGHLSLGIGEVLEDLETMGYRVEAGIFSAVEVGAPHQRKRVFILGDSTGERCRKTGKYISRSKKRITRASSKQLADSKLRCGNPGGESTGRKKGSNVDRSSERAKLGNSKSNNERGLPESSMYGERKQIRGSGCNELGNPNNKGLEIGGRKCKNPGAAEETQPPAFLPMLGWPAGPGQNQFEWEAPRTVADSKLSGEKLNRINRGMGREQEQPENNNEPHGKAKPGLGRTTDGTPNRVDRLRLLGNGVVPQVAEKAYLVLSEKLNGLK